MTADPAAPAANKQKISLDEMITTMHAEAKHHEIWSEAVTDGNRSGLLHKAAVFDRAAEVLAWVRDHESLILAWNDSRGRGRR